MLKPKMMMLSIFLICLFTVSAVSGADNITDEATGIDDATNDEINEDNYDIDEIIGETDDGTFTQLQEKISDATSDSVINFENNYTFDDDFASDVGIKIQDKKNLTINGNGYTIDAKGKSGIFYVKNSTLTLKNIIFKNGYDLEGAAVTCEDSSSFAVYNCTFLNNTATSQELRSFGGAILIFNTTAVIDSSIFRDNMAKSEIFADTFGGAIYSLGCRDTVISNCSFVNNFAYYGGAICFDSLFTDENLILGANEKVLNCNFTDNSAVECGAIKWGTDNGTLSNSIFNSNTAAFAGALGWGSYADVEIDAVTVGVNGKVLGCNFTNNHAEYCGAIFWDNVENGSVSNSIFINNTAKGSGGAVGWMGDNGKITLSTFTSNYIEAPEEEYWYDGGGAVNWQGNNGTISYSTFKSNSATLGGAIFLFSMFDEEEGFKGFNCTVFECNFTDNCAQQGGAVYWEGPNGNITGSTFKNNQVFMETSSYVGGAIFLLADNVTVSKSVFISNSAYNGGAIACIYMGEDDEGVMGLNGKILECSFTDNFAETGGAVYWTADNLTVSNSNFTNNNANDGGAFYCEASNVGILKSLFNDNRAESFGGAISWNGYEFEDYAGGINGTVLECNFTNNSAGLGGAVFWKGNNGTVSKSNFNSNHAEHSGGAISWGDYFNEEAVSGINGRVVECNFTSNTAEYRAGAILWHAVNGTVSNSNFDNNSAQSAGAIGLIRDFKLNIFNSNFTNNKASFGYGGAIHTVGQLTVANALFLNNKAKSESLVGIGNLTFQFRGQEGYMHAIENDGEFTFTNVIYWNGNVVNSDDVAPVQNTYPGINITVEVYCNGALVENVTLMTNASSQVQYDPYHLDDGEYTIKVYHADDSYYYASQTVEDSFTLSRNSSLVKINIEDGQEFIYNECNISFAVTNRTQVRVVITNLAGEVLVNQTTDDNYTIVGLGPNTFADDCYNITVYNEGNQYYAPSKDSKLFRIIQLVCNVVVSADEVVYGLNTTINITADVDGNYTLDINGTIINVTVVNGKGNVSLALPAGSYYANATYNNVSYVTNASNAIFKVLKVLIDAKDAKYAWNSKYSYQVKLADENGNPVSNQTVTFTVNGKTYSAISDDNGIACATLTSLDVGSYNIVVSNDLAGSVTKKISIASRLTAKDLVMDYDSKSFTVKVLGDDGNPIANTVVKMKVNGITYDRKTNSKGIASLPIKLMPKKYVITCTLKGFTIKNTIKVICTLKAKKSIKAKKGKDLVFNAKLKWSSGKAIKFKKLKFKFRGAKYFAKTNKKGIAKFTVSKDVISKLKVGKKYKSRISYKNETVKPKIKIVK